MKSTLTLMVAILTALSTLAQAWTKLKDIPEKLAFPVVVALGSDIHVIGGGGPGGATGLHLRYKTTTDVWDTLAPVPYQAQQPSGAVVNGKIHYFGGGFPNSGTPLNKHYVYTLSTDSWDTAAVIPVNRVIHESAVLGDSIYVMGGQPDKLRFERYDAVGNSWKKLKNLPDQDFWYGIMLTVNDTIYRFGGGGFLNPSNKAHRYNVESDSWTSLPDIPNYLHAPAGTAIGDSVYISGGYTQALETDEVWIYDVHTQIYSPGFALPSERNYHAAVTVGECIYSLGGNIAPLDVELIRHCRGDSVDYTAIRQVASDHQEMELRYSSGSLFIHVGEVLEGVDGYVGIYDVTGRMLSSSSVSLDATGNGRLDLDDKMIGTFALVRFIYAGKAKTLKIVRTKD